MPFGGALILGAVSAAPKLYAAYKQNKAAGELKLQDSTPAAFKEKLALSRQGAATSRLPGMGAQENRLGQVQAGALQNARLGAASSADFLASAGAADARRQQGEQQLGTQGLQYQDGMKRQLGADLSQQAEYQRRDLDNYNREKAALTEGAARNLDAGVSSAASYGAMGMNMNATKELYASNPGALGALGSPSSGGSVPYPVGLGTGRYQRQRQRGIGL